MIVRTRKAIRGFTLIELVIVIAVIAILAALLVPTILGQAERARLSRARADVAQIGKAIARMRTDTSVSSATCLTNFGNLTLLAASTDCTPINAPSGVLPLCSTTTPGYICWDGPYITIVTADPWSSSYTSTEDTTTYAVTVLSNGPNTTSPDSDDITYIQ